MQQPVTPHVDTQSEFPPPASTADDDPMPLPHVDDTPPWAYQEPETPWISTEQDTPLTIPQQLPLPSIQVSPSREETNVSTGDSMIPPPPWFDETPQQLRWRAGVLRALRPFRRLRDTQSDPSERVKRSRLGPAQVMSTAVAKHCDWPLDFDERGPVFDGAQDWRHSVFLTGRAARKAVYFASESPENQRLMLAAMEREWKK